jgi:hypothetical protein
LPEIFTISSAVNLPFILTIHWSLHSPNIWIESWRKNTGPCYLICTVTDCPSHWCLQVQPNFSPWLLHQFVAELSSTSTL